MKPTGVLDRNGQEIHVGDRVKIHGDEVLNYLQWCFDNDLPESISQDIADYFGIAVDDDFLQIFNENGDMLYDLSTNFEEPDPCLEIVTDDVGGLNDSGTCYSRNRRRFGKGL